MINNKDDEKWKYFKSKYSKGYRNNSVNDLKRKKIWKSKNALIEEHNKKFLKGLVTFTLGDNYFMDYVLFYNQFHLFNS